MPLKLLLIRSSAPGEASFPLRPENLEKMGRHFPVREKSGNFEETGKGKSVRENHIKYQKTEGISDNFICCFSVIFK